MKEITNCYTLDMTPGSKKTRVNLSQHDAGLRRLAFVLQIDGHPWVIPSGCTVVLTGQKQADRTIYAYDMDVSGCYASILVTDQMTAVPGTADCEIRVADADGTVGSCNFEIYTERDPLHGGSTSESDIPIMEQAIAAAGEALASAQLAEQHAENAETAAEEAAGSATTASDSATAASSSAATANAAAGRAENAMNAARTAANDAAESATLAQTAMEESATNAQNAADSASAAADSATTAETAATTATEKAAEAEQSATDAAGSAAEAQEAAAEIEADKPVIVALSVAGAGIRTAVTQSQETGEPVTVAAQYVTADPADADAIYDALHAGKRVRVDLTSDTGGGYAVRSSATRCRNAPDGRNIMHYIVGFDRGDLCNNFTGLAALRVTYIRDTSARNSVEVVVEAAAENFDLVFTAPISEPLTPQTTIPATANHTEEEAAAAYAAGKKVNVKIHFTNENPITFDLEPVYTVTIQEEGSTKRLYSGLLVAGTDMIDAYAISAGWENDGPVVIIAGKIADFAENVSDLETDVADLDGRVDALEEAEEARVEISVSRADVTSALTAAKSNTGANNTASISSSGITVSLDDLGAAKSALASGKKVRFDLKIMNGANVYAVVSTYTAVPSGNNLTLSFNCEGLTAFDGLQTIVFNYASSGSSAYVSSTLFANPKNVYYISFTCTASEFEQAYNAENTVTISCNRTYSAINTKVQYENNTSSTIAAKLFVTDSNKVVRAYELPIYERTGYEVNFRSAMEAAISAEESGTYSIPRIIACRIAVSQEGTQLVVASKDLSI